jgi:hypothetical protein
MALKPTYSCACSFVRLHRAEMAVVRTVVSSDPDKYADLIRVLSVLTVPADDEFDLTGGEAPETTEVRQQLRKVTHRPLIMADGASPPLPTKPSYDEVCELLRGHREEMRIMYAVVDEYDDVGEEIVSRVIAGRGNPGFALGHCFDMDPDGGEAPEAKGAMRTQLRFEQAVLSLAAAPHVATGGSQRSQRRSQPY